MRKHDRTVFVLEETLLIGVTSLDTSLDSHHVGVVQEIGVVGILGLDPGVNLAHFDFTGITDAFGTKVLR